MNPNELLARMFAAQQAGGGVPQGPPQMATPQVPQGPPAPQKPPQKSKGKPKPKGKK